MVATASTFTILGVDALEVRVEVDVRQGLPSFAIVGLPDAAVRESRERVRSAIVNSGFRFPYERIVANLAPADLRKAGPGFDLAIAVALLVASQQLDPKVLDRCAFAGELALDGRIRPVPGALAMAERAGELGFGRIVLAPRTAPDAALLAEIVPSAPAPAAVGLASLSRLGELAGEGVEAVRAPERRGDSQRLPDLADLRGQPYLRRALEVAAAGGHSLMLSGPPGAGKSMAARRLPGIMPPLAGPEILEVSRIASACGRGVDPGAALRPFRAPHHTISTAGLVGGGTPPRAGEVTLAHRGILFLDEIAEFSRHALEALRQPIEERWVRVTRAAHSVELPASFQLVAAANPCPCGIGDPAKGCECPDHAVRAYRSRVSAALADRIDLFLSVEQPDPGALAGPPGEPSSEVRLRVVDARDRQETRLGPGRCNAEMTDSEVSEFCPAASPGARTLEAAHRAGILSARGHGRVLRIARTLADLGGRDEIDETDLRSALRLRSRNAAERPGVDVGVL